MTAVWTKTHRRVRFQRCARTWSRFTGPSLTPLRLQGTPAPATCVSWPGRTLMVGAACFREGGLAWWNDWLVRRGGWGWVLWWWIDWWGGCCDWMIDGGVAVIEWLMGCCCDWMIDGGVAVTEWLTEGVAVTECWLGVFLWLNDDWVCCCDWMIDWRCYCDWMLTGGVAVTEWLTGGVAVTECWLGVLLWLNDWWGCCCDWMIDGGVAVTEWLTGGVAVTECWLGVFLWLNDDWVCCCDWMIDWRCYCDWMLTGGVAVTEWLTGGVAVTECWLGVLLWPMIDGSVAMTEFWLGVLLWPNDWLGVLLWLNVDWGCCCDQWLTGGVAVTEFWRGVLLWLNDCVCCDWMSDWKGCCCVWIIDWGNEVLVWCVFSAVKPPPMEVCLNPIELGVVVELTFQHEFSNVLNVFIKVIRKGNLPHCIAWISKLPSVSNAAFWVGFNLSLMIHILCQT